MLVFSKNNHYYLHVLLHTCHPTRFFFELCIILRGSNYNPADLYFYPISIHLLPLLPELAYMGSGLRRTLHIEATAIDNKSGRKLDSLRTKWRAILHRMCSMFSVMKKTAPRALGSGLLQVHPPPFHLHLLPHKGVRVHPAARRPQ